MDTGYLWIQSGLLAGATFPLHPGQNLIGRDASCQIVLPDPTISRRHAAVTVQPGGTYIADMGSSYGTMVNGVQIKESVWLTPDAVIQLGPDLTLVYQVPQATAPATTPTPVPVYTKPPKKKRSCLLWIVIILLILACGLLALGGAGYYMYTTGQITPLQLMNLLGAGEISIANLTDEMLEIELVQLETDAGEPSTFDNLSLESYGMDAIGSIPSGSYRLILKTPSNQPPGVTCHIRIKGGDIYQIVGVPEGFAISREGFNATNASELNMQTSSLCQP